MLINVIAKDGGECTLFHYKAQEGTDIFLCQHIWIGDGSSGIFYPLEIDAVEYARILEEIKPIVSASEVERKS